MKQVPWYEDVWIGLDTETTSANPLEARILECAIVTHDPEGVLIEEDRVIYIDPGVEIPAEASAIHGITAEKMKDLNAWKPKSGIEYIANIIQCRSINRNYPLVIYNVPYDWRVIQAECARQQIALSGKPLFLDPLVIDKKLDKYRKGSRKLADTAKIYGVPLGAGAHGAQADATASLGVMRALVKKFPELKKLTMEEIQDSQTRWYAEQRDHLNEYWASIGKEERATGEWPGGVE
jgi:DNA polymerase III subunit epsilon